MMPRVLEFWFEFGSTYSYPAAMRVEPSAAIVGATIVWRPFLLGPIFRGQGWNDSPFNLYPVKGRYMWRDLERICEKHRLPFRHPSVFPRHGLLAARVATVAAAEGWADRFVPAVYHANFADDRDIADPSVLAELIVQARRDPDAALDRAQAPANKDRLRAATDEAVARGIFGAPTFLVGDELFWGHDRLDDALAWTLRAG
jgi:2-hydroxychromene-2-carboxylate isomerase